MDDGRRRVLGDATRLIGLGSIAMVGQHATAGSDGGTTDRRGPIVSVSTFGARGDGTTDDGDAFTRALAWASATYQETGGATPRLHVPAGTYAYAQSPNFAISNLALDCAPGVVFHHRGAGSAFILDGGERDGVYRTQILGMPTIRGNNRSGIGVDVRALHHAVVTASIRDVATAALRTRWSVATEYRIRTSGLATGSDPVPVDGLLLGARNPGESTADCLFHLPIVEQVKNIGMRLIEAGNCTFLSGTSEANGVGGVHISSASNCNTFIGLDLEVNGRFGILCEGHRNGFIGIYDDKLSTFAGTGNSVRGHLFDTIVNKGDGNSFETLGYAAAGGSFTDTGTNTRKSLVRNLSNGRLDADFFGGSTPPIARPAGGAVRDSEARAAIAEVIARLQSLGLVGR